MNNNSIPNLIRRETIVLYSLNAMLILFPVAIVFFLLVILKKVEWYVPDLFIPHRKEILIYSLVPSLVLLYPFLFKIRRWVLDHISCLCAEVNV